MEFLLFSYKRLCTVAFGIRSHAIFCHRHFSFNSILFKFFKVIFISILLSFSQPFEKILFKNLTDEYDKLGVHGRPVQNITGTCVEFVFLTKKTVVQVFTARKGSLRSLCFYRCLSVHMGAGRGGAHVAGGVCGGNAWQGACMARERAWQGGIRGDDGGHAWQGRCVPHMPPPRADTMEYGQWAGIMHPSGMHFC